jgi:WD40 repeat protein
MCNMAQGKAEQGRNLFDINDPKLIDDFARYLSAHWPTDKQGVALSGAALAKKATIDRRTLSALLRRETKQLRPTLRRRLLDAMGRTEEDFAAFRCGHMSLAALPRFWRVTGSDTGRVPLRFHFEFHDDFLFGQVATEGDICSSRIYGNHFSFETRVNYVETLRGWGRNPNGGPPLSPVTERGQKVHQYRGEYLAQAQSIVLLRQDASGVVDKLTLTATPNKLRDCFDAQLQAGSVAYFEPGYVLAACHEGGVASLGFSSADFRTLSDGALLVTAGARDGLVKTWDLAEAALYRVHDLNAVHPLAKSAQQRVACKAAFAKQRLQVLAVAADSSVLLYYWAYGLGVGGHHPCKLDATIEQSIFSPDGVCALTVELTARGEHRLCVWRNWDATCGARHTLEVCNAIISVCASGDGRYLAWLEDSAQNHRSVKLWDLTSNTQVWETDISRSCNALAFDAGPSGLLLTQWNSDELTRIELASAQPCGAIMKTGIRSPARMLSSPNGGLLAVVSRDGHGIAVLDPARQCCVFHREFDFRIGAVAFGENNSVLALADDASGDIHLYVHDRRRE